MIEGEIKSLKQIHAKSLSRIEEYKRKYLDLSHRVLRVIVRQEIHRKMGYGILAEEEQLRIKLEAFQQALNAPTQFKVQYSVFTKVCADGMHSNVVCALALLVLCLYSA